MTVNSIDTDVSGALDLQTQDDGGLYLARAKDARGTFVLSVNGQGGESGVLLDRNNLLMLIAHSARLLAEDES